MRFTMTGACWLVTAFLGTALCARADDGVEFFEQRIRPVLVDRCYSCHSADAASKKTLKGGLLLDTRKALLKGGDGGPAVVPGKPADSLLIRAIRHESIEMPPKRKLSDETIADFVKWVQIGAPDPRDGSASAGSTIDIEAARRSWAYQTPKLPERPEVADEDWPRGDIDRLVLATLDGNGLRPAQSADKRTLIRRAAYDLLGLPPTPEEIAAFLADDDPGAFKRVVDGMLKSPDFGIRWARHWLDNVRYAQDDPTCNANNNGTFSVGPYRDWVVKSFNEDLPYDQFVRLQVAGDLMPLDDPELINTDGLTATGIWGLAHLVEGNDKEKVVADFVDEQLDVLGRTFLGLTVSCARCHDHKFDPITQSDYYALAGIFYSSHIFTFKGKSARERVRVQMRAVRTKTEQREIEPTEQQLSKLAAEIAAIEKKHENALKLMQVRRDLQAQMTLEPKTDNEKANIERRIKELRRKEVDLVADQKKKGWDENPAELKQHAKLVAERDEFNKKVGQFPLRMVMLEGPVPGTRHKEPGDMPVFIRGNHLSLGKTVPRTIPRVFVINDEEFEITGSGRLQLANWLTRPNHPLTARVMANRIWQHLFGRGIVATPSNFGRLGQPPTHPELLDYLAVRLVESGWSIKSLMREIMISRAYQQSSLSTLENVSRDPDNRWFGRMNRKRLDAEALMDTLAWHSDRVKRSDHDAPGWKLVLSGRTLFGEFTRDKPQTTLDLFDGANPDLLVPDRPDSTSAPQALFMLNNETVLTTAANLAKKTTTDTSDERQRIAYLYERLFGRSATDEEQTVAAQIIRQSRETRQQLVVAGEKGVDVQTGPWEDLCLALICSNEFLYVD
jgi:cytochrome c553